MPNNTIGLQDNKNTIWSNAGSHNCIYRGKFLGNTVTPQQYQAISNGSFDDLFIGDYWTIGDVNYRIAGFDYLLNCSDEQITKHHIVIVPDTALYNYVMNDTNTTANAYLGSKMRVSGLSQAISIIKSAFSGHVLKKRLYINNAVKDGIVTGGSWVDSEVDLMNEQMVYGSSIFTSMNNGTNVPTSHLVEKSQLPLFAHEPSRICNRSTWWLRDVANDYAFTYTDDYGIANYLNASYSRGVRPYFCIY